MDNNLFWLGLVFTAVPCGFVFYVMFLDMLPINKRFKLWQHTVVFIICFVLSCLLSLLIYFIVTLVPEVIK